MDGLELKLFTVNACKRVYDWLVSTKSKQRVLMVIVCHDSAGRRSVVLQPLHGGLLVLSHALATDSARAG